MTRTQRSWAIAAIAFTGGVGGGVVFPILPMVGVQLRISGAMIGLILSANRIARLLFNPATGSLLDRFGARWPVAAGLLLETIGSGAYAIALSADRPALWFLLGRIIWGLGSSLLLVGVLAAIMSISEDASRGGMTARVRTAISLGFPGGLVIGGLVADLVSDNAAFLVATGLSLAAAAGAACVMPDQAERRRSARATGASRWAAWSEVLSLGTLRIIFAANALLFFAVSGVLLATVALAVDARHLLLFGLGAQGSAGLLMAVLMGARASSSLACGRYLDRSTSRTRLLLPAMAGVASGFVILGLATNLTLAIIGLLLIGAGAGGLTIPMLTLLGDVAPARIHGRALSVYQWSSDLGGALGPILGLMCGRWVGYGPSYVAVGVLIVVMTLPLRHLAVDEQRRND
ncbi:MFS transporter [Salinisphaera sp. LB1]|uniref:MFS transporter n=1 Tax=Salinisphaera sp. LB1 TaxID=2183911 RepID=UPI000D708A72|nr:MFS transporter [Salinisphaera sp. LB1]AWN16093.1 Transporter, putative [Salinisphaera sp. LB1]